MRAAARNAVEQPALLGLRHLAPSFAGEVLAGAAHELTGGRLGDLHDLADLFVGVGERLAQHVGGPLGGREPLQHHEHGESERLGAFGAEGRVGAGVDRLGQPRADVGLAAGARRLQRVDREPRRRRREERRRVLHDRSVGALPAQPRILHDVLGLARAAEHAVGDAEEPVAPQLKAASASSRFASMSVLSVGGWGRIRPVKAETGWRGRM